MEKKRLYATAVFIMMLLLLAGCKNASQKDALKSGDNSAMQGALQDPCQGLSRDECRFRAAASSGEPRMCNGIESVDTHRQCLFSIALSREDPSICSNAMEASQKDVCLKDYALRLSDPVVCSLVAAQFQKDACLLNIAVKDKNIEICQTLSGESKVSECISVAGR